MSWRCLELLLTTDGRVLRCERREWWHRWWGKHRWTGSDEVQSWDRRCNTAAAAPSTWPATEEVPHR